MPRLPSAALILAIACSSPDRAAEHAVSLAGYTEVRAIRVGQGKIVAAERLSNGSILIRSVPDLVMLVDSATNEVVTIGKQGAGPGEFHRLGWAGGGGGDSIWAFDITSKRLMLFDKRGRYSREWEVGGPGGLSVVTRRTDGTFVLSDSANQFALKLPDSVPRLIGRRPPLELRLDSVSVPLGARIVQRGPGWLLAIVSTDGEESVRLFLRN